MTNPTASPTAKPCCAPKRDGASAPNGQAGPDLAHLLAAEPADHIVDIPGGTALIGTNAPEIPVDEEGPMRNKSVKPFRMDATPVSNARFARFVAETGYVTEAETFGNSFVFHLNLSDEIGLTQGVQGAEWWRMVDGACWHRPHGPGSEAQCLPDHPVVQVSWTDARAFAKWAGGRLPTEAEWEHAARGGLGDVRFPWGDQEPDDTDFLPCNIWQGRFPHENTAADGYVTTSPVQSYDPNGYGLYNMVGNVWEWTTEPFKIRSLRKVVRNAHKGKAGFKLQKGGSFLCHSSYCYRYRIAARHGNSPDTATGHQGVRLVYDA